MFRHHSLVRNGKTSNVQRRCIADESTAADSIKDTRFDGNNCLASQAIAKNHLCRVCVCAPRVGATLLDSGRTKLAISRAATLIRKKLRIVRPSHPLRNPFAIRRRSVANFCPTRDQHTFRMVLILAQNSNTPPERAYVRTSSRPGLREQ